MRRMRRVVALAVLLCGLLVCGTPRARASIPNGAEVVLIFVGVGVIGAAIGVGVYYAARRPPTVTGCAAAGSGGLRLRDEGGGESFALTGDLTGVHAGERVRLRGKKKGKGGDRMFVTDRMVKDFGGCAATP